MFLASDIMVKISNCPWDVGRFCRYVNIEQRMSSRDRNMSKWLQKWFTFALCTLEVVKYFRSKISIILRALRPITTSSQSFYIFCSTTYIVFEKHRKNCECCHHHSVFKDHNVIVHIVVLNCQKCNQCLKCQVSGHKNFQNI